jgi:hypothetical protein
MVRLFKDKKIVNQKRPGRDEEKNMSEDNRTGRAAPRARAGKPNPIARSLRRLASAIKLSGRVSEDSLLSLRGLGLSTVQWWTVHARVNIGFLSRGAARKSLPRNAFSFHVAVMSQGVSVWETLLAVGKRCVYRCTSSITMMMQ